jgi:hypothetical protein
MTKADKKARAHGRHYTARQKWIRSLSHFCDSLGDQSLLQEKRDKLLENLTALRELVPDLVIPEQKEISNMNVGTIPGIPPQSDMNATTGDYTLKPWYEKDYPLERSRVLRAIAEKWTVKCHVKALTVALEKANRLVTCKLSRLTTAVSTETNHAETTAETNHAEIFLRALNAPRTWCESKITC